MFGTEPPPVLVHYLSITIVVIQFHGSGTRRRYPLPLLPLWEFSFRRLSRLGFEDRIATAFLIHYGTSLACFPFCLRVKESVLELR
jgi:hypothetical protein